MTTITDVAPIMNWVYIDRETYEAKYGVRVDAQHNLTGPFDCTRQDRRLTFDGWEGWCAVEEVPGHWALYFDLDDNGLAAKIGRETRVLEIELSRKEKRWRKDGEERSADQSTKRAVKTEGDVPVDEPVAAQPEVVPPGGGGIEEKPLRPFGLPRSIFSDPPRPLFWGEEMSVPLGPPPAYVRVEEGRSDVGGGVLPPEPESAPELKAGSTRPQTPPGDVEDFSAPRERKYRESAFETPRQAPAPPKNEKAETPLRKGPNISTPGRSNGDDTFATPQRKAAIPASQQPETPPEKLQNTPLPGRSNGNDAFTTPRRAPSPLVETTPIAPASLKMLAPPEKRSTPKLNRMSGTRAMSQAQMFEAWATGQTPTSKSAFKRPDVRPISNVTSASDDMESAKLDEDEILQLYGSLNPSKSEAPAVTQTNQLQGKPSGPFAASDPAVFARLSSGSSTTSDPAIAKQNTIAQQPISRKRPPKDPSPRTPLNRRQDAASARDRNASSDQARRPSATSARDFPRSTRQAVRPTTSTASSTSWDRNGSLSSQSRGSENSRSSPLPPIRPEAPLKRGERPSPRPPTRTNTAPARNGPDRARTTSSLFREIDDLVGASMQRSGSTASNASNVRRNGSRSEDREAPLRRAVTAREPRRTDGPARRVERDLERRY